MYYYNVNGAALASLIPLEGLGLEVEPAGGWRLFAAVSGDPVLGRGSFKVNHPGQLLSGHGLEAITHSLNRSPFLRVNIHHVLIHIIPFY